jgi:hypothetical protein
MGQRGTRLSLAKHQRGKKTSKEADDDAAEAWQRRGASSSFDGEVRDEGTHQRVHNNQRR